MEYAIVVFLLFFAVLAFAWFYLQRAKTRTPDDASASTTTTTTTTDSTDTPAS